MGTAIAKTGARELSEKEIQERREQAFALERAIKNKLEDYHAARWAVAEELWRFKEMRGWELLGYKTITEWLAQPDVNLPRSTFDHDAQMWKELAVVRQLPPDDFKELETSKVAEIVPAIKAGHVKVEDALDDAKEMGFRDLRDKYRYKVGGQLPDDSEPLDADAEPERCQCPGCGRWLDVDRLTEFGRKVIDGKATDTSEK